MSMASQNGRPRMISGALQRREEKTHSVTSVELSDFELLHCTAFCLFSFRFRFATISLYLCFHFNSIFNSIPMHETHTERRAPNKGSSLLHCAWRAASWGKCSATFLLESPKASSRSTRHTPCRSSATCGVQFYIKLQQTRGKKFLKNVVEGGFQVVAVLISD